jgi:hypothetical protein
MADQPGVAEQAFQRLVGHRPHPAQVEAVERLLEGRPFRVDQAVLEPGAKDPARHFRQIAVVGRRGEFRRRLGLQQPRLQRGGAEPGARRVEDRGEGGARHCLTMVSRLLLRCDCRRRA